ncbi:hypothetical protein WNY59_09210 [Ahrensia kielensis]|uniref:Uncharacterized protein n=1 Tax=Ahrensia kielensis TaxID=76980 RepID=A0ABU9T7M3_9HYPH
MSEEQTETTKVKRFRSPPYPAYDLGAAVERAKALYQKANNHSVGATVLADAWNMKSVDGKVWRAAAALLQYGLLNNSGTGKTRKFQLTDLAKRIILDQIPDSEAQKTALKRAALSPMIHNELWDKYQTATGLSDAVIRTYLTVDRTEEGESPYSISAADEVLNIYRSTLVYAGMSDSDQTETFEKYAPEKQNENSILNSNANLKLGDYVKWTLNGIDQFLAKQVTWISDDGKVLRVLGIPSEIPTTQVEIVKTVTPEEIKTKQPIEKENAVEPVTNTNGGSKIQNISAHLVNGRLQLTADVGLNEIQQLKDILSKYEEILELMS